MGEANQAGWVHTVKKDSLSLEHWGQGAPLENVTPRALVCLTLVSVLECIVQRENKIEGNVVRRSL